MTPLDHRRFLFITGKGGTGKTTVTAALAVALAARGRRVLITVTEAKERISSLLGVAPLEQDIVQALPNISVVKINPDVAMREYGELILKSRTVSDAVFGNKYVRGFFAAVPGLHQWAMLGKAWFHATETLPNGSQRFDVVLFDAPATGHGLDMLRVPKVIVDVVPPGLLRRDAERAWTMFRDPNQSGIIIVALPEDMPANESIELADALRGELQLPIASVVVNQVADFLFSEGERETLLAGLTLEPNDPGDEGLAAAVRRAQTEKVQSDGLGKLRQNIAAPLVELPRLIDDPSSPDAISDLARLLDARIFGEAARD